MNVEELETCGIIAFDGSIRNALHLHPSGEYIIYPIGNKITIKHIKTAEQFFLAGHQNFVCSLCISSSGNIIASGQISHHGFKAKVIIWEYEQRKIKTSYEMHKVRVEDVCFTTNEQYLISLGGRDDGRIIVWDVQNGSPLCGTFVGNEAIGNAITIVRTNIHEMSFMTAGERSIKLWRISQKERKAYGTDVKVGKLKRVINCLVIDDKDDNVYCGTTSGDIIKAKLNLDGESEEPNKCPTMVGCYSKIPTRASSANGDQVEVYAGGINKLLLLNTAKLIVGTGDGTIETIEISKKFAAYSSDTRKNKLIIPAIVTYQTTNVCGAVTSMVQHKNDLLVGTAQCEIYEIALLNFRMRLIVTCHTSPIYDVTFPRNCSEIFITSGKHDIRVWKVTTHKELLRITVPNFVCSSLCFDSKGGSIISAWNDGVVRCFALNGGQILYEINRAHTKAVSAVATTSNDCKLVTGGCEGEVRIWNAKSVKRDLLKVLKEHRGSITSLDISPNNMYVVSSSTDGTCIIWDLCILARKIMLKGNTMYMKAAFTPDGKQVLTCGRDRKIAYWETLDGSLLREVEGSTAGTLNTLSISPDGQCFISGSDDCIVKLWEYQTANIIRLGLNHAAEVTASVFSPDNKIMVTGSADGAIILWKNTPTYKT